MVSAVAILSATPLIQAHAADKPELLIAQANRTASYDPNISYVTGGIGDDERMAMENAQHDYNVHVTNVGPEGAFVGETQLAVLDAKGRQIFDTVAGPLFYINLEPGKYTISAVNAGMKQTKRITVTSKSDTNISFLWN